MPRPAIDKKIRSKTHTLSCRDAEWNALQQLVFEMRLHTPFDVLRSLVRGSGDSRIRKVVEKFDQPRAASARTLKIRKVA